MKNEMYDILDKTYKYPVLRKKTVPLFMSSPGLGKSTIIREFAQEKKVRMLKMTLSQRMPNEVVGMVFPNVNTGKLEVFDSYELESLVDGDILFIDEVFNGTLKQTLDSFLNLLEDRTLPSGKKLADIMIVAASNPQGLMNLTPQIKERFIRYDLKFNIDDFCSYMKNKYGMPDKVSKNIAILINKEKFDLDTWGYDSARSVEKAITQIACGLKTTYDEVLLPFLNLEIECPMDLTMLNVKKGEQVKYVELLKILIQNDTTNKI